MPRIEPFRSARLPRAGDGGPGAEERLAVLVRDYGRLIAHAIRHVVGASSRFDVEDVEQQVHVALWKQLRREQTIDHPASYVYKAAVREAVRALRRHRARAEEPLENAAPEIAGPESRPERLTEARSMQQQLTEALLTMQPDRARAVRAHLAGFTVDEMMDLYDWTYERARNLIARGMGDLRAELRSRGLR